MKPFIQSVGMTAIGVGILHLLFPRQWHAFFLPKAVRLLPSGQRLQVEQWYGQVPVTTQRLEGFSWLAAGALLLWWAGPAETRASREAAARVGWAQQ